MLTTTSHPHNDRARWLALGGLIIGTVLLSRSLPTSFAFDRVYHSALVTLIFSGVTLLALGRWLARTDHALLGLGISLNDHSRKNASRNPSPSRRDEHLATSSTRALVVRSLVLVVTLCARIELLRIIVRHVQCANLSWAPLIPAVLVARECWHSWFERQHVDLSLPQIREPKSTTSKRGHLWTLAATFLVTISGFVALSSTAGQRSTVICAAGLHYRWLIPALQFLSTVLDVVSLFCVKRILLLHGAGSARTGILPVTVLAYVAWSTAAVLFFVGSVYFLSEREHRTWVLTFSHLYLNDVLRLNVLIVSTLLCAVICLFFFGMTTTAMITTSTSILTLATASASELTTAYPPSSLVTGLWSSCLVMVAFIAWATSTFRFGELKPPGKAYLVFYSSIAVFCLVWAGMWRVHATTTTYHPIDRLIYEAQHQHSLNAKHATMSTSLSSAALEYQRRYKRHPPPNFDKWYEFAKDHGSIIMDDYDSIERDLKPFFALTPEDIRHRTWQLISKPWNDAAGLMIRNGSVSVAPNVVPTHRWMMDGPAEMIGKFSQWLPDMDLAFNLNDEPRVSVPYRTTQQMNLAAEEFDSDHDHEAPHRSFSAHRQEQWLEVSEDSESETVLEELSWQRIFHRYGAEGCPSYSDSHVRRPWNTGRVCVSCTAPHSMGAFLSNWTKAADICHQPDLADLHGFYLSPASFKGTKDLFPVFSQSKAHGFNDILYPSAWNYLDKAKYEPSDENPDIAFSNKNDTIFWRGATSEGTSVGTDSWKDMTRQRFVHMTNNVNDTSPPQALLVPTGDAGELKYKNVPSAKLLDILPADIHVVETIHRCGGPDCDQQAKEFGPLVEPTNFQSFWQYKYLLDMDGAGFSGRFLPFLQSKSLPFKSALFREWYDDRITAWLHFVPIDLRGQGFWATYAYFRGFDGDLGKGVGKVSVEAHTKEAEIIAMEGRGWANKVLRKEDMEIYMFRLLLEWGRLTDDARQEIAYIRQ